MCERCGGGRGRESGERERRRWRLRVPRQSSQRPALSLSLPHLQRRGADQGQQPGGRGERQEHGQDDAPVAHHLCCCRFFLGREGARETMTAATTEPLFFFRLHASARARAVCVLRELRERRRVCCCCNTTAFVCVCVCVRARESRRASSRKKKRGRAAHRSRLTRSSPQPAPPPPPSSGPALPDPTRNQGAGTPQV